MTFFDDPDIPDYMITVLDAGTAIDYAGGIKFGAAESLRRALDANPKVRIVRLDSGGGRLAVGRNFRPLIHARPLSTYLSGECMSACALAFLGGEERLLSPTGKLGFHSPAGPTKLSREEVEEEKEELRRGGLPEWFINRVFATANTSIWFPSQEELLQAKV